MECFTCYKNRPFVDMVLLDGDKIICLDCHYHVKTRVLTELRNSIPLGEYVDDSDNIGLKEIKREAGLAITRRFIFPLLGKMTTKAIASKAGLGYRTLLTAIESDDVLKTRYLSVKMTRRGDPT